MRSSLDANAPIQKNRPFRSWHLWRWTVFRKEQIGCIDVRYHVHFCLDVLNPCWAFYADVSRHPHMLRNSIKRIDLSNLDATTWISAFFQQVPQLVFKCGHATIKIDDWLSELLWNWEVAFIWKIMTMESSKRESNGDETSYTWLVPDASWRQVRVCLEVWCGCYCADVHVFFFGVNQQLTHTHNITQQDLEEWNNLHVLHDAECAASPPLLSWAASLSSVAPQILFGSWGGLLFVPSANSSEEK